MAYFLFCFNVLTCSINIRIIRKLIFLIVCFIIENKLYALENEGVWILRSNFNNTNIDSDFYIYDEEIHAPKTINEITKNQHRFKKSNTKVAAYFADLSGHWLKFNLKSLTKKDLVIDMGTLSYESLHCYVFENEKLVFQDSLNWKVPISKRKIKSEFYAFPFTAYPDKIYKVYIRGSNFKGTFRLPIRLRSKEGFYETTAQNERFYGVFLGVSIFIVSLGFSFYFLSKDKTYLYYILNVLALILQSTIINSYLNNWILEIWTPLADPTHGNLFIPFYAFFHILFLKIILLNKEKSPAWTGKFSNILSKASMVLVLIMFACLYSTNVYKPMAYLVYLLYLNLLIHFIICLWQGFKFNKGNAYFVLLSNTPFFLYLLYMILTNLRVVKQNSPYQIVMWCLLFDNIILCIGLAFRFSKLSKSEVFLQKEINKELEAKFHAENSLQKEKIEKLQAQVALEIEKKRISRDLHDNIGSQLTYITSNIDYLSRKVDEKPDFQEKLNELNEYIRSTNQQLRDTIWTINKEKISLFDFFERVKNFLLKQTENLNINRNIEFDLQNDHLFLNSNAALNLFRTLQEAINNLMKYSNAKRLSLVVKSDATHLYINLKDNGEGFDVNEKKNSGFGLNNMISRIEEINGICEINSKPKQGTEIKISCKLNSIIQDK